jgi:hypothetical protein
MEYAFLSDFDLLRHPERGVEVRPWADPAARLLMDTYFKIEHAREEILRCDIEIRRLVTYIRDEREFLESREKKIAETDPGLSWCVRCHRRQRERYDDIHLRRLNKLAAKAGTRFTGTLVPGVALNPCGQNVEPMEGVEEPAQTNAEVTAMEIMGIRDVEREIDDDLGDIVEEEQLAEELHLIYVASQE